LRHAAHCDAVNLQRERHELLAQRAAFRRQVNVEVLTVVCELLAADVAELFHRLDRCERARLAHADLFGELSLRKAVALPQGAQKAPVPEGHAVLREPRLQCAHEAAPGFLGQVGKPI
jgi:hypothetical protein